MKVVFITSMTPSGHYSQYITKGLHQQKDIDLIVYAGLHEAGKVDAKKYGTVKYVWKKSLTYISDILRELERDKPDIVHVQQEFNMYGGVLTGALFPLLILQIRMAGYKTVVTIHAAVHKHQVNDEFIHLFHKNSKIMRPFILKSFFQYVYMTTSWIADTMFVHTKLKQKILTEDYAVSPKKLTFMPIVIPDKKTNNVKKDKYFFYFGYMVRRKGLQHALEGFKKFIDSHPRSPFKLVLAGGVIKGQEKAFEEIKDFIALNRLEKYILMKGFIEEQEQDKLYNRAYAVIIPAKVSMGSSGPLFHAMSYGKCVIATREGYFKEDIIHLKTGILTDNTKWKNAFEFAVNHPKLIANIEKNVTKKARDQEPATVARRYVQVYNSL